MIRQTITFSRKIILWALSLSLLLLVLCGTAMIGADLWLRSDNGQAFIKQRLESALAQTPYRVEYGRALLHSGLGLSIDTLKISDERGVFLTIDNVRLSVNPGLLPAHIISASLHADHVDLQRLPKEPEKADKSPGRAFDPSAFWFRSIIVKRFAVDRFDIGESLGGQPLSFSPDFEASIAFKKDALPVHLKGHVESKSHDKITPFLPADIAIDSAITPTFDLLTLTGFSIRHKDYALSGKGAFGLSEEGACNGEATLDIASLASLLNIQDGTLHVDFACAGPALNPSLKAAGKAAFPGLADIGPVAFNLETAHAATGMEGKADIEGTYKNQPYTLAAPFTLQNGILTLDDIRGTLPETSIAGHILYNLDKNGADGKAEISIRSLEPYARLLKQDMAGRADIALSAQTENEKQKISVDIKAQDMRFQDIKASSLHLTGSTDDIRTGTINQAKLSIGNLVIKDISVASATLTVTPAANKNFDFSLKAGGAYQAKPLGLTGKGVVMLDDAWRFSGINISPTALTVQGRDLILKGSLTTQQADLHLSFDKMPLSTLMPAPSEAAGRFIVNGRLDVTGLSSRPEAKASINASRLAVKGEKLPDIRISITSAYQDGKLSATLNGEGDGIKTLKADAATGMTLSLWPFAFSLPADTSLKGALAASLSIEQLGKYIMPSGMTAKGNAETRLAIGGTLSTPDLAGTITLNNGAFAQPQNGLYLRNITLQSSWKDRRLTVNTLSATDNASGTLQGKGWIEPLGMQPKADLDITIRHFQAVKNDIADIFASAGLTLKPDHDGFALGGKIEIEEANIRIPEKFGSNVPELNTIDKRDLRKKAEQKPALPVRLDIALKAGNRVFVRGWGLDAEFGGSVDINGLATAPDLQGQFDVIHGRFQQFGKVFKLDKASLIFQGAVPPGPYIDVSASTPAQDVTASVNITGPARQPKLAFSSDPALPEDEVLSRILFGKDAKSISPFQAIQLANTLRQFSGAGGGASFDPVGKIRQLTGVDELNVDTDDSGAVTVGAGKYITDRVYVGAEQGSAEKSGAVKVETEITPSLSLESKIGQQQSGAGFFWKRDY